MAAACFLAADPPLVSLTLSFWASFSNEAFCIIMNEISDIAAATVSAGSFKKKKGQLVRATIGLLDLEFDTVPRVFKGQWFRRWLA